MMRRLLLGGGILLMLQAGSVAAFRDPSSDGGNPHLWYLFWLRRCESQGTTNLMRWEAARAQGDQEQMRFFHGGIAADCAFLSNARFRFYEFGRTNAPALTEGARRTWEDVRAICEKGTHPQKGADFMAIDPRELLESVKEEKTLMGADGGMTDSSEDWRKGRYFVPGKTNDPNYPVTLRDPKRNMAPVQPPESRKKESQARQAAPQVAGKPILVVICIAVIVAALAAWYAVKRGRL